MAKADCTKCKIAPRDNRGNDAWCGDCRAAVMRAWRRKNPTYEARRYQKHKVTKEHKQAMSGESFDLELREFSLDEVLNSRDF